MVCLPPPGTKNLFAGVSVTVDGWGTVNGRYKKIPQKLQKVVLKTLSNSDCAAGEFSKPFYPEISPHMLCARAEGKGSCYGDSGGKLQASLRRSLDISRSMGIS